MDPNFNTDNNANTGAPDLSSTTGPDPNMLATAPGAPSPAPAEEPIITQETSGGDEPQPEPLTPAEPLPGSLGSVTNGAPAAPAPEVPDFTPPAPAQPIEPTPV